MCGRFSLKTPIPDLADMFDADPRAISDWHARYNLAPTEDVIALRSGTEGRELVSLRWGLIPAWSEDPDDLPLMINARSESLEVRRAFRDLIIDRRCAVLADGFYEWRTEGGVKQPYFVRRRDRHPMPLAGLWDVWKGPRGSVASCTIITTEANDLLTPLHDRMPVVLDAEGAQLWLAEELDERTVEPLRPCDSHALETYPVSRRVNRVVVDDPGCIEPLDRPIRGREAWGSRPTEGNATPEQLGFF